MKIAKLDHKFVDFFPNEIEDGVLYISIPYAIVEHRCCCGCGNRVVTPLSPTDWSLTFDGTSVSLHPSIGNWSFPCQSHYWIRKSEVIEAPGWSQERVEAGRRQDRKAKDAYFQAAGPVGEPTQDALQSESALSRMRRAIRCIFRRHR